MLQNLLCLWKKKTHVVFFVFHLKQLLFFPYGCPGLCRHKPVHKGKMKVALNEKQKKTTWVFFLHKHSKFWSISLGQKVERKPFFSEECGTIFQFIPAYYVYCCEWGANSLVTHIQKKFPRRLKFTDFCQSRSRQRLKWWTGQPEN